MNNLRDKQYYTNLYDKFTVDRCRFGEDVVNKTFSETKKKIDDEKIEQPEEGLYLHYSIFYFQLVEVVALQRSEEKEKTIDDWMKRDEELDNRFDSAKPKVIPFCPSCGKDMAIRHKHTMSRQPSSEEEVLFMFECESCKKCKAYWQDGTEWELVTRCEKCNTIMNKKDNRESNLIHTTYTCPKCEHSYTDTLDLNYTPRREPEDPFLDLDRRRFCLDDHLVNKIKMKANHIVRMINLHLNRIDQTENYHVFDAIKDLKTLKIAQLSEVLRPVVEKENYSEFKLGEPQFEREVSVSFNCLDNKPDREEYDSKKNLQKLISEMLEDSNWRLMSDGVRYRLGYLSGRLRAYESEEDLRKLVEQQFKDGKKKKTEESAEIKLKPMDLREGCLVYFQNMTLGTELVDKEKRQGDYIMITKHEFHEDLRVIIPARENDDSVPEFVRNFDFVRTNRSLVERKRKKKEAK